MVGLSGYRFNWRLWLNVAGTLILAALAAIILLGWDGGVIVDNFPPRGVPTAPVPMAGAVQRGSSVATVGLIVFSDFQCPSCRTFAAEILPTLLAKYVDPGRVSLAFRYFPIERLNPDALGTAELASCAASVDRFWPVHNAFFAAPTISDAREFRLRALGTGLTAEALDGCRRQGLAMNQVKRDVELARSLGVQGTPTTLIGRLQDGQLRVSTSILGSRPLARYEATINDLLQGRPIK